MNNKDKYIDAYYALRPKDFPIVVNLAVQQLLSVGAWSLSLEIEACSSEDRDRRRLFLSFNGVTQLRLNQQWSLLTLPLLEIISLRGQQWESANYKVHESEQDSLSFFCKNFTATIKDCQ